MYKKIDNPKKIDISPSATATWPKVGKIGILPSINGNPLSFKGKKSPQYLLAALQFSDGVLSLGGCVPAEPLAFRTITAKIRIIFRKDPLDHSGRIKFHFAANENPFVSPPPYPPFAIRFKFLYDPLVDRFEHLQIL
jgi:hypothetical protein